MLYFLAFKNEHNPLGKLNVAHFYSCIFLVYTEVRGKPLLFYLHEFLVRINAFQLIKNGMRLNCISISLKLRSFKLSALFRIYSGVSYSK